MKPRVVHLDLRGRAADDALDQTRRLLADKEHLTLARLLVLDDTAALADREAVFEHLLTSGLVDPELVLCLAVGPSPSALTLPGNVGTGQGPGVLWVADTTGVDWPLSASTPATRRDDESAGLHRLLEVLAAPDLFDRVCGLARVPGGVSCPGLRLAGVSGGQEEFLLALATAGDRMLARSGAGAPSSGAGLADLPGAGQATLAPGGPLGVLAERGRKDVAVAVEVEARLPTVAALFGERVPVQEYARAAGDSLEGLRTQIGDLFVRAHSTGEPAPAQRELLQGQGLRLVPADPDPPKIRRAIEGQVTDGLARGASLRHLAEGLRGAARDLEPRGSRQYVAELDRACPPVLTDRLRDPWPFPPPEPWLPLVGAVLTAAASLHTSFGLFTGLAMMALWIWLVALSISRAPVGLGTGQPLVWNAVGAAAGLVGGTALAFLPPPALVWPIGLVLAPSVAVLVVLASWRSRTTRWLEGSGLPVALGALEALLATLTTVAATEWASVTARLDTVDALIKAAASVEGVAELLTEYTASLRKDLAGKQRSASGPSGNLVAVVSDHLRQLVRVALEPRWRELTTDDQPPTHRRLAGQSTKTLLDQWEKHVEDYGPVEPPPFLPQRADEPATARAAISAEDLEDIVRAAGGDPLGVMWQLCGAGDLRGLDSGAKTPPAVRFAPRAWLPEIGDRLPAGTVWISAGRHAGVLRLVPLRPGLVVHAWTTTRPAEDAAS